MGAKWAKLEVTLVDKTTSRWSLGQLSALPIAPSMGNSITPTLYRSYLGGNLSFFLFSAILTYLGEPWSYLGEKTFPNSISFPRSGPKSVGGLV